jgi:hypothetical protein
MYVFTYLLEILFKRTMNSKIGDNINTSNNNSAGMVVDF